MHEEQPGRVCDVDAVNIHECLRKITKQDHSLAGEALGKVLAIHTTPARLTAPVDVGRFGPGKCSQCISFGKPVADYGDWHEHNATGVCANCGAIAGEVCKTVQAIFDVFYPSDEGDLSAELPAP